MRNCDLWGVAPGNNFIDRSLCEVDPITLGALAVGSLVGGGAAALSGGGSGAAPTPTPPPSAPPPQQKPLPKKQTNEPSFIGGVPAPPPSTGQKTLLGQ